MVHLPDCEQRQRQQDSWTWYLTIHRERLGVELLLGGEPGIAVGLRPRCVRCICCIRCRLGGARVRFGRKDQLPRLAMELWLSCCCCAVPWLVKMASSCVGTVEKVSWLRQ